MHIEQTSNYVETSRVSASRKSKLGSWSRTVLAIRLSSRLSSSLLVHHVVLVVSRPNIRSCCSTVCGVVSWLPCPSVASGSLVAPLLLGSTVVKSRPSSSLSSKGARKGMDLQHQFRHFLTQLQRILLPWLASGNGESGRLRSSSVGPLSELTLKKKKNSR